MQIPGLVAMVEDVWLPSKLESEGSPGPFSGDRENLQWLGPTSKARWSRLVFGLALVNRCFALVIFEPAALSRSARAIAKKASSIPLMVCLFADAWACSVGVLERAEACPLTQAVRLATTGAGSSWASTPRGEAKRREAPLRRAALADVASRHGPVEGHASCALQVFCGGSSSSSDGELSEEETASVSLLTVEVAAPWELRLEASNLKAKALQVWGLSDTRGRREEKET